MADRSATRRPASAFRCIAVGASLLLAACGTVSPTGPATGVSVPAAASIDSIRQKNDVAALTPDSKLEQAALQQAAYMAHAGELAHTTGSGRDFASRMRSAGIHGWREENIAYGRFDMAKVLDVWMHSPPHRKNMLNPVIRHFGLAYIDDGKGDGRRYWVLVLDS